MTDPQIEILKQVNVSSDCYTHSYENHIGSEQNIDAEFIHKNLQILYFYPFKSQGNLEQDKAEAFAIQIFQQAVSRFAFDKVLNAVLASHTNVAEFIECFDTACMDLVKISQEMDEPYFRQVVNEFDIIHTQTMKKQWSKLAEVITALCNYEPEEAEPEQTNSIPLGESMDLTQTAF